MSRRFADLRASEIPSRIKPGATLVLPVGAIEQHGPHLPVSTDLVIATTLAERAMAEYGERFDLWLLPPLVHAASDGDAWAPGTLALHSRTLLAALDDLGRGLAALPARRVVLVNAHRGSVDVLGLAVRELHAEHGLLSFLVPAWDGSADASDGAELGMGVHAGRDETSLMLHLRPELCDMAGAERAVPEEMSHRSRVRFGGDVAFGWTSVDLAPNGVLGDPTLATAERGAHLAERSVARLGEALAEVAGFGFPLPGLARV